MCLIFSYIQIPFQFTVKYCTTNSKTLAEKPVNGAQSIVNTRWVDDKGIK